MSDTTPAEKLRARVATRIGPCLACVCEKYERGEYADGFQTCTCFHTQWSHGVQDPVDGV